MRAEHSEQAKLRGYQCESDGAQISAADVFYVGLVRKPTPPALGPPSKLHAELLFPAAATLEPSVHQGLKVCPPATEGMICSASHSLWLFFFWFHILHLTVVCHDSINIIRKPSPWPGCTHVFDCVCTLRGAMPAGAA